MRQRRIVNRIPLTPLRPISRPSSLSILYTQRLASTSSKPRPTLPFLSQPRPVPIRTFASERTKKWLKHEAKLFVRYAIIFWGGAACLFVIYYSIIEEVLERDFPTPHEWPWKSRKQLRDAHKWCDARHRHVTWAKTLELARNLILFIEDPEKEGGQIPRLSEMLDQSLEVPWEFIPHDLSGMSEEWRRGYFETIMLAAKAAEKVDGWLRDVNRNCISAPEYVIGPSNPRPKPIPPGSPRAPREEDCEIAYPSADRWYLKILATKGLSPRQQMEAAFEYANFMEYKQRGEGIDALYNLALAEATRGMDASRLPYDTKTFTLKEAYTPSLNVLDAITAIANYKARQGALSTALPIYISLLKARRSLSDTPPLQALQQRKPRESMSRKAINIFAPPEYPPPPSDGTSPPWRSPEEKCQEASLNLYIGEILYATTSQVEGLAWTREGVDEAEEHLRTLPPNKASKTPNPARQTCRECLNTGLGNWATMVARLVKEEQSKKETGGKGGNMFSFWGGKEEVAGRWVAESAVVKERVRRTKELVEDVKVPEQGLMKFFQA